MFVEEKCALCFEQVERGDIQDRNSNRIAGKEFCAFNAGGKIIKTTEQNGGMNRQMKSVLGPKR